MRVREVNESNVGAQRGEGVIAACVFRMKFASKLRFSLTTATVKTHTSDTREVCVRSRRGWNTQTNHGHVYP